MAHTDSIYRRFDYLCGSILLLTVTFCYVIMQTLWLLDINSGHFAMPVAFILATLCMCLPFDRFYLKRYAAAVFSAMAIFVVCGGISSLFTDASFDGMLYHQEQVALIFNGWNPCLRPLEPAVSNVWVNHYPMGMETVGAAIMGLSGHLQSAKAVIPIMAIMTFLLCRGLLAEVIPDTKSYVRTWIAVLIACNPVIVAQLPSSYVDGTIAEYVALTILLAIAIVVHGKSDWHNYLLLAAVIMIAVATKFNALLYELITAALLFIGFWIYGYLKKSLRFFAMAITFGVAGVFLFSYYPYVTNWLNAGHPLYPLAGADTIDIVSETTDLTFGEDSSRLANFFRSIYTVNLRAGAATQLMGFSITFMVLFPLSVVIIAIDAIRRRRFTPELYSMICLIGSCFIFKACWWARYVPQLWLIVPLAYYTINRSGLSFSSQGYTDSRKKDRFAHALSVSIDALAIFGAIQIFSYTALTTFRYTCHRNALYATLSTDTVPMTGAYPQFIRLMEEHCINVIPIDFYSKPSEVINHYDNTNRGTAICNYTLNDYAEPIITDWPFIYLWLKPEQAEKLDRELKHTSFYRLYSTIKPDSSEINLYNEPLLTLRQLDSYQIPQP